MKSFKEYLTESKKVYEFKVKIAGDCPDDCKDQIKQALSKYSVENCSDGHRTPIIESHADFPDQKNVSVTMFDVCLAYPANSQQVAFEVMQKLKIPACCVKVRSIKEEEEFELNHQNDEKTNEVLLTKDYEKSSNQDLVGEKQKMKLLKELSKMKNAGEQYKGINDKLLAKKAPSEKSAASKAEKSGTSSPLGKVSNPDPRKGKVK